MSMIVKEKVVMKDNIYDAKIDNPKDFTFNNVFRLKDNEWTTVMSGEQLAELWTSRQILFHPDCQRGIKLKRGRDGKLRPEAVCSPKNINEIKKSITNDEYSPDEITLNILDDGNSIVNVENGVMEATGLIFITDGQHRLKALSQLLSTNKILGYDEIDLKNKFFNVKITNYTLDKSGEIFYQFTKGLKISKSLAESFNKKDSVNIIVNKLNKSGVFKDRIDTVKTNIATNDPTHIVTFATLVNAITDSYGMIDDEKMESNVFEFISTFLTELTIIFPELLNDEERALSKQYELTCENFMFYAWIELSQLLYCDRFNVSWKDKLNNISKINFNKLDDDGDDVNPIWKSIIRYGGEGKTYITNNKTTRQVLRRIIKEQFYMVQN